MPLFLHQVRWPDGRPEGQQGRRSQEQEGEAEQGGEEEDDERGKEEAGQGENFWFSLQLLSVPVYVKGTPFETCLDF